MTWTLASVTVAKNANAQFPQLANLVRTVTFVFNDINSDGVVQGTHSYTEPNVSDVSAAGLAKLARDQLAQLQKISDSESGPYAVGVVADISPLTTLINAPPVLSPAVVAAIRAAADFTQTNDQIAAALNTVNQPNPITAAPMVDPPWDVATLQGKLSQADQTAIGNSPWGPAMSAAIQARDTTVIRNIAGLLAGAGVLSVASYEAVTAYLAPIADPMWTAEVSTASLIAGRPLTAADIAEARARAA